MKRQELEELQRSIEAEENELAASVTSLQINNIEDVKEASTEEDEGDLEASFEL